MKDLEGPGTDKTDLSLKIDLAPGLDENCSLIYTYFENVLLDNTKF